MVSNQFTFRHSSRKEPLKVPMKQLSVGFHRLACRNSSSRGFCEFSPEAHFLTLHAINLLTTTTAGAISSELQALLPRGTTAKEETVLDLSRFALYPHQAAGVDFLARRGRAILGDDMGLGKTRQAIIALRESAPTGVFLVIRSRSGSSSTTISWRVTRTGCARWPGPGWHSMRRTSSRTRASARHKR
jgi:hypothetical protein